jgi:hypothetical protein
MKGATAEFFDYLIVDIQWLLGIVVKERNGSLCRSQASGQASGQTSGQTSGEDEC